MRSILVAFVALALLAGCDQDRSAPEDGETAGVDETSAGPEDSDTAPAAPEETREPNADWQAPAFEGQTRAPRPAASERWKVERIAEKLSHPWAVEVLSDGSFLVTERPGQLRWISAEGDVSEPISGVPEVHAYGQGGLLDIALSPDFEETGRIYLSYAEPREGGASGTAVATAVLSPSNDALSGLEVIFRQQPDWDSRGHYGSRILFTPDGHMFVTLGERMDEQARQHAQDPADHLGTVVRLNRDGSIPDDNPFVGDEQGADEVWSYGHRNIQAADLHPETGELWVIEHGARGGDELNRPEPGKNYGWPVITYGENYNGSRVGDGMTAKDGMEQPVYYWDPVIAPSGMDFYEGTTFPAWQGDLFVGGLASEQVVRLVMEEGRVVAEEWLPIGERVRDVKEGPDGFLYLVTDEDNGKLLRLVPDA